MLIMKMSNVITTRATKVYCVDRRMFPTVKYRWTFCGGMGKQDVVNLWGVSRFPATGCCCFYDHETTLYSHARLSSPLETDPWFCMEFYGFIRRKHTSVPFNCWIAANFRDVSSSPSRRRMSVLFFRHTAKTSPEEIHQYSGLLILKRVSRVQLKSRLNFGNPRFVRIGQTDETQICWEMARSRRWMALASVK